MYKKDGSIIGQEKARESLGIIIDLAKKQFTSGQIFLLNGPSSSGKSALLHAFRQDFNGPLMHISASTLVNNKFNSTEMINKYLRSAIKITIKEIKDIYEGEVTEYYVNENRTEIFISLKTLKGSKRIKISPNLYKIIENEK